MREQPEVKEFSKEKFRELVSQRTDDLKQLSFDDLKRLGNSPTEHIAIEGRSATVDITVQCFEDGSLRVVIQGFMRGRLLPVKDVVLGGFYKNPDGGIRAMPEEEFYEFD